MWWGIATAVFTIIVGLSLCGYGIYLILKDADYD